MNLPEVADAMMTATRATKIDCCARQGGPEDLSPLVDLWTADGQHFVALVPDRDFIGTAVEAFDSEPAFIGFCADAHMQVMGGEDPATIERGELLRRFGLGDMSVTEMLVVSVVEAKTGDAICLGCRYTYNDVGQPVFEAVQTFDGIEGQVVENLRAACRS